MFFKYWTIIGISALSATQALGDGWQSSYEDGVKAAHDGKWSDARTCFKRADSQKHKDSDKPFRINPTDGNFWNNGGPYSPNFLAAYCQYEVALTCKDPAAQHQNFQSAQQDFERLISSGQRSRDAYYFLDLTYTRLNLTDKRSKLEGQFRTENFDWKVDDSCIRPDEVASIETALGAVVINRPSRTILAANLDPNDPNRELGTIGADGPDDQVPHDPKKFAFIVGSDAPQLGSLPCASFDAKLIRDGLVRFAGYDPANVILIENGTSVAISDGAKRLAGRLSGDSVVLVFYAGPGSSIHGHDFLGGSDTTSRFTPETMVSKSTIYQTLLEKGAKIFSFYEVSRPIENGFFFGSEVPQAGPVSQMEATIPDSEVTTTYMNGKQTGLYASAFYEVLSELKSNRLPIYEFGWQIYNKMKRGRQIPTLPVLNNLAADSRF